MLQILIITTITLDLFRALRQLKPEQLLISRDPGKSDF